MASDELNVVKAPTIEENIDKLFGNGSDSLPRHREDGKLSSLSLLMRCRSGSPSSATCGIPALRALFLFLSFPIRDPALNPSYEFSNHVHHQARQHKYAFKPATTCTTTSSLISFRLTSSTISSSLSYEIVDDFDPYPGYFYVSLFSDLENTEIPSSYCILAQVHCFDKTHSGLQQVAHTNGLLSCGRFQTQNFSFPDTIMRKTSSAGLYNMLFF